MKGYPETRMLTSPYTSCVMSINISVWQCLTAEYLITIWCRLFSSLSVRRHSMHSVCLNKLTRAEGELTNRTGWNGFKEGYKEYLLNPADTFILTGRGSRCR